MSDDAAAVAHVVAAGDAVIDELRTALQSEGGARRVRTYHVAKNATLAAVSNAVGAVPQASYGALEAVYARLVAAVYNDVAIPMDIADAFAKDLHKRFTAANARPYLGYLKKNSVALRDASDNARSAAPPRAEGSACFEPLPMQSSSSSGDASESMGDASRRTSSGSASNRWRVSLVEQRHRLAHLLEAELHAAPRVSMSQLFDKGVAAGWIRPPGKNGVTPGLKGKFARLVLRAAEMLPPLVKAAVGNDEVIRCDAATTDGGLLAPINVRHDARYDEAFQIGMHLLQRNFHLKAPGATPQSYPGHNICCVVVDGQGRFVGFDSNQCKLDQNLCSHAEKRLAEAMTAALKPLVAAGKPPSLEGFAFISTLEPCHMCANFISRMGVKRIGYLMADPMQKNALTIAANLLDLEVYRPSAAWGTTLEEAFTASPLPEDEITTWLGSEGCREALAGLCAAAPLSDDGARFVERCAPYYPGCVDIGVGGLRVASAAAATPSDDAVALDDVILDDLRSTSSLLAEASDDDDDLDDCDVQSQAAAAVVASPQ